MLKEFRYEGEHSICFGLFSNHASYTLANGESTVIACSKEDETLFPAWEKMGLHVTDYKPAQPTAVEPVAEIPAEVKSDTSEEPAADEAIKEDFPMNAPVEEISDTKDETPAEEASEETEKVEYSVDELMKMTKSALCELADSLGVTYPEKASKKVIAESICNDK